MPCFPGTPATAKAAGQRGRCEANDEPRSWSNTASVPCRMAEAVQQKIQARVEETFDGERGEPPHAKVDVKQRLLGKRGDDQTSGNRCIGVRAKLTALLAVLDQALDEFPSLHETPGPGREDIGRLGRHLAEDHALPET